MADTYTLSDGSKLDLPEGTTEPDAVKLVGNAENGLAAYYSAQAAKQNSPVTPIKEDGTQGDLVYSASTHYPNTYIGQTMAHLDHWVPGVNALNSVVNQSSIGKGVNAAVFDPLGRAESNAISWPVDLPGSIYNVVKHQATPGSIAANAPDAPSRRRVAQRSGRP